MKKSELKQIIKEEIQKVLKENIDVTLSGFNLAQAYKSKQWGDVLEDLMYQDLSASKSKALVSRLKAEVLVVEVDLEEASGWNEADEEILDPYIETATPIKELAKIDTDWAKEYAAKGYKYFAFIPVDYNRGTNYINLALSKSQDLISIIQGDY